MLAFEDYTFEMAGRVLRYRGIQVRLEPRVAELLAYLIQNAGRLITRDELLSQLWPTGSATDAALNYVASSLRRALSGCRGRPLAAVRGRGYRFDAILSDASHELELLRLIGRAPELQTLRRAAASCAEKRTTSLVLVTGPAGIGKSRLVQELRAEWLERGDPCLSGHCMERDSSPPLWPWQGMLEGCTRLVKHPQPAARAEPFSRLDLPVSRADRQAYYVAAREQLEASANRQPLLVILEDLHLADDASLTLLQFLASGTRDVPILYVVTCRTPLLPPSEPSIEKLVRVGRVVSLGPLSDTGSRRLLQSVLGTGIEQNLERDLLRSAAGNPLFLKELAFGVKTQPEQPVPALLRESPSALRDAIHWHLCAIDEQTLAVLRVAAVAGEQFDARLVAMALDTDISIVISALSQAVKLHVVHPTSQLDYCFRHALFHQYLYEQLPETTRREHHWRLGMSRVRTNQHRAGFGLSQAAHDLAVGALSASQAAEAAALGLLSADALVRRFAFESAAREYERTLRLAKTSGASSFSQVTLLVRAADCRRIGGQSSEARRLADEAIEFARAHQDGIGLGEAACALARTELGTPLPAEAVPVLREALEGVPSTELNLRARLLAQLAQSLCFTPHLEERHAACAEASLLAKTADKKTRAFVLLAHAHVHWGLLDEKHLWEGWLEEALLAAQEANEPDLELQSRLFQITAALESGEVELLEYRRKLVLNRANELGSAFGLYLSEAQKACLAVFRADSDADTHCRAAWELGKVSMPALANHVHTAQRFILSWERGQAAAILQPLIAEVHANGNHPAYVAALGLTCALAGERQRATEIYNGLAAAGFPDTHDNTALASLTVYAELCSYVGDFGRAQTLYDRLLPFAGKLGVTGAGLTVLGLPAYALARLAAGLGCFDAARSHFAEALELATRFRSRPWMRRCQAGLERLSTNPRLDEWPARHA